MAPREFQHDPALAGFLHQRDGQKILQHQPQHAAAKRHIQQACERALDRARNHTRQRAEQHQLQQKPRRLFFNPVEPVHLHHQKRGGHQRGQQ